MSYYNHINTLIGIQYINLNAIEILNENNKIRTVRLNAAKHYIKCRLDKVQSTTNILIASTWGIFEPNTTKDPTSIRDATPSVYAAYEQPYMKNHLI